MSATIYLPGRGVVDLEANRVDRAVHEYDERLSFARNEETGDYCIFIKMERGWDGPDAGLPVLGFGKQIPHPEDALKRLYQADSLRRGNEILDDINRTNDDVHKQLDAAAHEGAGHYVEALESYMVHNGQTRHLRSLSKSVESRRTGGKA